MVGIGGSRQRDGDTVVVPGMDRLARNLDDLASGKG